MSITNRATGGGGIGFFERIKTGLTLTKDSLYVIRDHPKLLVFPLIAGLASLGFFILFFVPLLIANLVGSGLEFVVLFVLYFLTTFVSTYFSAALVYGANKAFHGDDPEIMECINAVRTRVGPIVVWSVIAATVSVILRSIEQSNNPLSGILGALFALGWSIMTFFIVPVIVFEEVTVTSMFKRSGSVFKDTWGETLGSGFGITFIVGVIGLVLVVLALLVAAPVATLFPGPGIVLAILLVGGAFVFAYLLSQTVWAIAKTALYMYAVEGTTPEQFDDFEFETLGGRTEHAGSPPSSGTAGSFAGR